MDNNSFEGLPVDPCVDHDDDTLSSEQVDIQKVTKVLKSVRIKCERCDKWLYDEGKVCKRCLNIG